MTAPTCCGSRPDPISALPTVRARSAPTGRRQSASASRCASCGSPIWPTTSTGPPTSSSSTGRPDRSPDAEPGARRPPVSRVPEGTRRLAPTCRLAGGCTTHGLLRRSPLLGGLACRSPLGRLLRRSPLLGSLAHCRTLRRLLRRSPLLGSLPCRSPLLGGLAHCRTLRRLLRRSPLLGGLASRSPLGCLLRRSPLLRSLPRRSPLHGLPCRSSLHGLLRRRALRCLLCGGPLFCGLLGRGPSFCGYCHRCTSLGAWSLNRGEACATSGLSTPRCAHCRTGFTCNCVGRRSCASVMNASTSRQTDLIPRVALSRRRRATTNRARQNEADRFRFARHTPLCRSTCHTLPHTSGTYILVLFTCPGQAFFIRAVILQSLTTVV